MKEFVNALVCKNKNSAIPEEFNYFGFLVGEWDINWVDNLGGQERIVKGEWIFQWVLEGMAIQDLFIVPSRSERIINSQADAEYGTTIRIYNPNTNVWDIFYGCVGDSFRLEARKEKNDIVLTEITNKKMKWVFSEIAENQFRWQKLESSDFINWNVVANLFAKRKF